MTAVRKRPPARAARLALIALLLIAPPLAALAAPARPAGAAERVTLDRVKLVVDNLVLTEREVSSIFSLQERELRQTYKGEDLEQRIAELKQELTARMIDDLLLETRARKLGIEVKEADINRRMDAIAAREPNAIATYGEAELKSFILKDLLKQQVMQREVNAFVHVDDGDVAAACRKAGAGAREIHVGHILARGDSPEALKKIGEAQQALAGGMDFLEAAQKFSEDPSAAQNKGDLGFVKAGQFVKEFEQTAFAMQPGQVSPPVKTQFGYHLIKVFETRTLAAENCDNMDETTRSRYLDQVYQEQREKRLKDFLAKLRAEATIRILD